MTDLPMTRRQMLAAATVAGGTLAMPSILRAQGALDTLVLQSPGSGPAITLSHGLAIDAFRDVAGKVEFSTWNTADELRANLTAGKVQVAVVPTQGAASMYNRGFPLHMVTLMTDGHCGLISRDPAVTEIAHLPGRKVGVPFFNDFTGHVMRLALKHHGIAPDAVELVPATTQMEGAQLLTSGRVEVALLAEPMGSAAIMAAKKEGATLTRGRQMKDEMGAITGLRPSLPQAGLAVTSDFAKAHPDLVEALHKAIEVSVASALANPEAAAKDAAARLDRPAPLLAAAIPFANLAAHRASVARPEVEAMFTALLGADPAIIGGKLPDDGFYLI